jgi:hypothetical protein
MSTFINIEALSELPHPFGLELPTSMLMVLVSASKALFVVDY